MASQEVDHKRRYYPSNTDETYVVNAITGVRYPCKVGSLASRQLYRVVDTTGVCDSQGRELPVRYRPNKNTNFLYFDNKEQFLRFFNKGQRQGQSHNIVADEPDENLA
jgi:hypothetical protein